MVWAFYGPWLQLMLWVGLPLLLFGTPSTFLFARGSFWRWLVSRFALGGWALVLLSVALYYILRIFQDAASKFPGT